MLGGERANTRGNLKYTMKEENRDHRQAIEKGMEMNTYKRSQNDGQISTERWRERAGDVIEAKRVEKKQT